MRIKPFTMSILTGSAACNARCTFCVSKMTPPQGVEIKCAPASHHNLRQACLLARQSGVTTILLTGKGEPTLFPDEITAKLEAISEFEFPMIELQTNGIKLATDELGETRTPNRYTKKYSYLERWWELGLRVIAISNVGIDRELNRQVYTPYASEYYDLASLVEKLHSWHYTVRLTTVMIKGGVDSYEKVLELTSWARQHNVEQVSVRPVTLSNRNTDEDVAAWMQRYGLSGWEVQAIVDGVNRSHPLLLTLPHGATIHDVDGQNLCLTNCLTHSSSPDEIRQLIYFPDGHLRYSWEYEGAIIL